METVPLVYQQYHALKCDTGLLVGRFCGDDSSYIWDREFDASVNNVVVITGGLLQNLLEGRKVDLQR